MAQMSAPQAERELSALIRRFDTWRNQRTSRREPIPDSLWDQAISLASVLPVSRVAKRLRLNRQELRRRLVKATSRAVPATVAPPTPEFIEVKADPAWLEPAQAIDLELERPDGARLRLHYRDTQTPVVALVKAFLEVS